MEVKCSPEDPTGDCMVACISQSLNKWSGHPAAEYKYKVKVVEFLVYAGTEALFLGPKDGDSHTILYFPLHHKLTKARDRRAFIPCTVTRTHTNQARNQRHEANRQFEGPGQNQCKG